MFDAIRKRMLLFLQVCEPMCLFMQSQLPRSKYVGCLGSSGNARKARPIWVFKKLRKADYFAHEQARAADAAKFLERFYPFVPKSYAALEQKLKPTQKYAYSGRSKNEKKDESYVSTTILKCRGMPSKHDPFFDLSGSVITKKAYEARSTSEVKAALEILNPPVKIIETVVKRANGIASTFRVFRDDFLPGGTKQRALGLLLFASKAKAHLYAGPENGFAQVALSQASKICKKQAISMVASPKYGRQRHPSVNRAVEFGAKLVEIPPPNTLQDLKKESARYCKRSKDTVLLPFGLDCEAFVGSLESALRQALPANLLKNGPRRLWLVVGSAVLFATFHRIWPNTQFLVVQVGKKVWLDQLEGKIVKKFVAPEKFWEPARKLPPYPTVKTYDAKLWQFVLKYGKDGDYVWNVASDPE